MKARIPAVAVLGLSAVCLFGGMLAGQEKEDRTLLSQEQNVQLGYYAAVFGPGAGVTAPRSTTWESVRLSASS